MNNKMIIAKLDKMLRNQPFGAIITRDEMPELIGIAPNVGSVYQLGQYTIRRAKVDHLDQFTIGKPLPMRCPIHNSRLDKDGNCWFCDNPE